MPGIIFNSCMVVLILATLHGPFLSCPDHQRNALLQYKSLLPAEQSRYMTGLETWNAKTPDCCRWQLVNCEGDTVTQLHLSGNPSSADLEPVSTDVLTPLFHVRSLTDLDLAFSQLEGEIPGIGLANLTELVYLGLQGNRLSGSIPWQLFTLSLLESIYLNDNMIEGNLEDRMVDGSNVKIGIGNLTRLGSLILQGNRLSGPIPKSLSNLKSLAFLQLGNNSFTQEIPSWIGNLSNLYSLTLYNNKLSGEIPSSIQKLDNLETLDLNNNLLKGEIPSWLFDMKSLQDLDLGDNKLTLRNTTLVPKTVFDTISLRSCNLFGEIPLWIANQTNLHDLDLSNNYLIGTIPQLLTNTSLKLLSLSDNMLSGPLPPNLFESNQISSLDLGGNNFSGPLPENIGHATSIQLLMLPGNNLLGSLPKSLLNMSVLKVLDLSYNGFSGNDLPFTNASYLAHVHLAANNFFGQVPVTFGQGIETLVLSHNEFSGTLPTNLTRLNQLKYLDLHDNNIIGELPSFLFDMLLLQILDISNNSLQGSIPSDLSKLNNLQILDLSYNKLSGEIPPSLGNLSRMSNNYDTSSTLLNYDYDYESMPTSLKGIDSRQNRELEVFWKKLKRGLAGHNLQMYTLLDLSMNQLSGHIPSTLGSLKELKSLNLSHNQLLEQIPMSFGQMHSIESLDLSHNNLTGEIPQTFSNLLELGYLDLSNNKLEGPIASGPQMDRLNDPSFYANNNGLCGEQIQVACKEASAAGPQPQKSKKEEETWFSWKMAGVGFPVGFLSTIVTMWAIGFFTFPPQRRPHNYVRQNFSVLRRRT